MWSPIRRVGIMEPEGILKASSAKVRIRRAGRTATRLASVSSRTADFFRTAVVGCASASGTVSGRVWSTGRLTAWPSRPQDREERFLRNLDAPELLHPLLAFFLALEKLPLPRDVAAVALGGDVLAERAHRLPGDDPAPDRRLDDDLEELPGNHALELLGERLAALVGLVPVDDQGEGVHGIAVQEDVELDELGGPEVGEVVVEGRVAPRQR